ncbi:PREDICTED: egg cell-secreted protein 1.1-like [Lupinus angustifolius]|nr:PREDICTED: egg cell-secreted protein 1.1-like [Lupinus angustifolius]
MMASTHNLCILFTLLVLLLSSPMAMSRPLSNPSTLSLVARLKLEDGTSSSNCWDSLFQIQACSGEIIMFFLNGETYLGNGCCHAIRVIQHDCWPNIVHSLGFTGEETDVLEGYCDEAVHSTTPPSSTFVEPKDIVP